MLVHLQCMITLTHSYVNNGCDTSNVLIAVCLCRHLTVR